MITKKMFVDALNEAQVRHAGKIRRGDDAFAIDLVEAAEDVVSVDWGTFVHVDVHFDGPRQARCEVHHCNASCSDGWDLVFDVYETRKRGVVVEVSP